jgi:hypothetical protein
MSKSKDRVQMAFLMPLSVRAMIQRIKLIRLEREVGRYNGSEIVEDAVRTLLKLEEDVDADLGLPPVEAVEAAYAKPKIVSGPPKYVPLNIPAFEKMPDQVIPNFTDEQIAELLKKVAEGK